MIMAHQGNGLEMIYIDLPGQLSDTNRFTLMVLKLRHLLGFMWPGILQESRKTMLKIGIIQMTNTSAFSP